MTVNSDAIYGTRPIAPYKQGQVALTRKGERLYATYLAADGEQTPPAQITLTGFRPKRGSRVRMLGIEAAPKWHVSGDQLVIETPKSALSKPPCEHAWTYMLDVKMEDER
jgi:alpha-L-fucosidase